MYLGVLKIKIRDNIRGNGKIEIEMKQGYVGIKVKYIKLKLYVRYKYGLNS